MYHGDIMVTAIARDHGFYGDSEYTVGGQNSLEKNRDRIMERSGADWLKC